MDLTALRHNLRRFRMARGLSQGEVAAAAALSRVGYRNLETGAATPRVDTLVKVAAALGVQLEDLLAVVHPLTHVRFRADKRMTTREEVLADVTRWLDDYVHLEELLDDHPTYVFKRVRDEVHGLRPGPKRGKAAAEHARRAAGLDHHGRHELIRDVCGLLEDHGVKVLARPIASEGFFGLSVAEPPRGPAIVVNVWERLSVERWIFTALHELGHLLLHTSAYDVTRQDEDPSEEKEADVFAAHFLMPEDLFRREWDEACGLPVVERVLKVKRIFHVSWRTVLHRLDETLPMGAEIWTRFLEAYETQTGVVLGRKDEPQRMDAGDFGRPTPKAAQEPDHCGAHDFMRDRLDRLVRRAVDRKLITMDRAAGVLGISPEAMRLRASAWVG